MVCMGVANIVNLAVNLVLVPGAFGAPALGAQGASWATFASRVFLTLAILVCVARMPDARSLGVFDKPQSDPAREANSDASVTATVRPAFSRSALSRR